MTDDDLKTEKKYKVNEEDKNKRLNILCIIEDILAQIEDMYERYYTNYKLAYAYNNSIIEDIKKQNSYVHTISKLVDVFYIDEKQEKDAKELKDTYQELVTILLSDKTCSSILTSSNNLANILDKKTFDIAKSYIKDVAYLNNGCLKDIVKYHVDKHSFVTKDYYKYLNPNATYKEKELLKESKNYKQLHFYGDNPEFTKIQEDPRIVVSYLMFAIFFANKYEEKIRKSEKFERIDSLRKKLYFKIKQMAPYPLISEENARDIKNVIKKQKNSYFKIIEREDKFFDDYDSLKTQLIKKSYEFDTSPIEFKSNFLYSNKEKFYKNEAKLQTPKSILKKIEKQLQNEELKKLLKIYEEIKIEDEEAYIISCMNIVCLLSYPRIKLDEEIDKISFFDSKLKHIYTFVENLTDRRILLSDEIKDRITNEYKISDVYLDMILRLIKYAYFSSDNQKINAKKFISKYEKKEKRNYFVKLEDINDHLFDEKFQSKNLTEDITSTLYTINGFSQKTIDLFEAMKDKDFDRIKIPKYIKDKLDKLTGTSNKIKVASGIIALLSLGIYIFRKDKNIQNTMSVIDDILHMTKVVTERMLVNSVNANKSAGTAEKTIQEILKDKKIQSMSKRTLEIITKVGVPLIIINGTYSSLKLLSNGDYDASFLSGLKTVLTVSLLIASGVTSYILLFLLEIVWNYFSHYIIDSSIEKYLYKSLLYEDIYKHSGFINIGSLSHISYKAHYLLETTNKNEKLKAINSDGFNKPKKLINFIGENYDENKEYFDTALRNELSFFKSSLFGYKLEKDKIKSHQKVKTVNGYEINFYAYEGLKIPKVIGDDEDFKLFFSPYKDKYLEINKTVLIDTNGIFNFFPEKNSYFILNTFTNKIRKENHISYIIVKSSLINLKYKIVFKDLNKITSSNLIPKMDCEIKIESLEQISFTPEDMKYIE
ncbi:hypothetical protein CRV00_12530 [Malaciobacter molluscorum]|nr:hypothetical protein CRV00_12530 [Malaciobacter molluscorum]